MEAKSSKFAVQVQQIDLDFRATKLA